MQRDFLWLGIGYDKKDHLISWDVVCKPREFGGLGIGKTSLRNHALLGKWLWRALSSYLNDKSHLLGRLWVGRSDFEVGRSVVFILFRALNDRELKSVGNPLLRLQGKAMRRDEEDRREWLDAKKSTKERMVFGEPLLSMQWRRISGSHPPGLC
ncbi:hypothetical protein CK203_109411 [Vitis vinifera]|uniref:Uncharacterized protein n=1 Tax=Vitis vinifera TaxID=29760 RepID=A0A438BQN9_VITVI|nr:hypothetical protein CK203_109411 [Vitis vinifera]